MRTDWDKNPTKPWLNLTNGKQIEFLLNHANSNSGVWEVWHSQDALMAMHNKILPFNIKDIERARDNAMEIICSANKYRIINILANRIRTTDHSTMTDVSDAMAALIAWDHAGSYLSLEPKDLRIIAGLGSDPAILLMPATIILKMTNDIFKAPAK